MARTRKTAGRTAGSTADDFSRAAGDSAQKIWLAGLGAWERARSEGPKMFETLVEQGKSLGGKAREAADQALRSLRDASADAGGRFDKLEQVFEDRVSKSLRRLGVLTRSEVVDLSKQVSELTDDVREMMKRQSGAAARAAGTTKRRAKRTASKAKGAAGRTARKGARKARGAARRATRG